MQELIVATLSTVGQLFLLAWLLAVILLVWALWKYRNKTWEDDIEWDVEPDLPYVKIKEAEYGERNH